MKSSQVVQVVPVEVDSPSDDLDALELKERLEEVVRWQEEDVESVSEQGSDDMTAYELHSTPPGEVVKEEAFESKVS